MTVLWNALHVCVLALFGTLAGVFNAAAGGGSLLTFPALVSLGLPVLTANLSNTVAQCPGNLVIAHAYRSDYASQGARVIRLIPPALVGGGAGIALLEIGSYSAFRVLAPILVFLACLLLAFQGHVRKLLRVASRQRRSAVGLDVGVAVVCTYCGYFGAAAGVMMLAVLGTYFADELQRLNALSRLVILMVNSLAGAAFIVIGPINWTSIAILSPAIIIGGRLGAGIVQRLNARCLRVVIVVIGTLSSAYLILTSW